MKKATKFGPFIKLNSENDRPAVCGKNSNDTVSKPNTRYNAISLSYFSEIGKENIMQFNIQNSKNSHPSCESSIDKKSQNFDKSPSPIKKNNKFPTDLFSFETKMNKCGDNRKPIQLQREVLVDHVSIVTKNASTSKPLTINQNVSNIQANPNTNFLFEKPSSDFPRKIQPISYYPPQPNYLNNIPCPYYPINNEWNYYQNPHYVVQNNPVQVNYFHY